MKQQFIQPLALILVIVLITMLTACGGDVLPIQEDPGTPVENENEARELLQSWLDNHQFDSPVIINDEMTSEDDSAFIFFLYQTDELAKIRVIKANGKLLRYNPTSNAYNFIDDWYAHFDDYSMQTQLSTTAKPPANTSPATNIAPPTTAPPTTTPPPPKKNDYPGEVLYKGSPAYLYLNYSANKIVEKFGIPLYEDYCYFEYADIAFNYYDDSEEKICTILGKPAAFEIDGVTFDKINRAKLISLFGNPTEENWDEDWNGNKFYYLLYERSNYVITFILYDKNKQVDKIGIGPISVGFNEEDGYSGNKSQSVIIDGKFEIIKEARLEKEDFFQSIVGEIKNITNTTYDLLITFSLYDSFGNQIGTAIDSITNLKGGNTWRFKVTVWESDAVDFEFVEITYR